MDPAWTLSGGGALVGVHLGHRTTRDLDLFWHGSEELGRNAVEAGHRLTAAGLRVDVIQTTPGFVRLRVSGGGEAVVVDLVAEPVATIEPPEFHEVGSARVPVDTPHEILVNKLCALLSRRELRDLRDVLALLEAGGDLERALSDAPNKDGGFSPLTLAWLLRDLPVQEMARGEGVEHADALLPARDELVARILAAARPPEA
jgi:hypothetical protein